MEARQAAEVGGRLVGRDRTFSESGHCRRIIRQREQGALTEVKKAIRQHRLRKYPCLFQVAVCESPRQVGFSHELRLNGGREGMTPHNGLLTGREEDATHAGLGCIGGPHNGRVVWDYLGQPRGAFREALCQSFKVVKVVSDVLVDSDAVFVGVFEAQLQRREQAAGTWDCQRDKTQLANDLLPFAQAHPTLAPQFVEQGLDSDLAVVGELNGLCQGVDDPPKHQLAGPPRAVTFQQLLQGGWFAAVAVLGVRGGKYVVDG